MHYAEIMATDRRVIDERLFDIWIGDPFIEKNIYNSKEFIYH